MCYIFKYCFIFVKLTQKYCDKEVGSFNTVLQVAIFHLRGFQISVPYHTLNTLKISFYFSLRNFSLVWFTHILVAV